MQVSVTGLADSVRFVQLLIVRRCFVVTAAGTEDVSAVPTGMRTADGGSVRSFRTHVNVFYILIRL